MYHWPILLWFKFAYNDVAAAPKRWTLQLAKENWVTKSVRLQMLQQVLYPRSGSILGSPCQKNEKGEKVMHRQKKTICKHCRCCGVLSTPAVKNAIWRRSPQTTTKSAGITCKTFESLIKSLNEYLLQLVHTYALHSTYYLAGALEYTLSLSVFLFVFCFSFKNITVKIVPRPWYWGIIVPWDPDIVTSLLSAHTRQDGRQKDQRVNDRNKQTIFLFPPLSFLSITTSFVSVSV